MATQFIGLHMRVVLREPPGYQLTGIVRDVEAGSSLTLTNVYIPSTKEHAPHMRLNALNIADLSEVAQEQPPPQLPAQKAPKAQSATTQPPPAAKFVDPAILSVGRPPASSTPSISGKEISGAQLDDNSSHQGVLYGIHAGPHPGEAPDGGDLGKLLKGFNMAKPAVEAPNNENMQTPEATPHKKKSRAKNGKQSNTAATPAAAVPGSHGKGWRQTPILQSTASFQPFKALKRNGKNANDNGWASEDVTEEMGEFDFENNLAKFDKRTIFDQMRRDDIVDESERLVSHNRKPKPGTAGGKNLHYSENVLDLPSTHNADYWNSEAEVGGNDGTSERQSGREQRNGQVVRRADSKSGPSRRSQSRKASGNAVGGQPLSRVNSSVRPVQLSRRSSPRSGYRSAEYMQQQLQQPGLYLVPSNRRLEAISTLQMLNLENIAANEIGLTESLMAENSGRGIAEVAVLALSDPAMRARYELAGASSNDVSLSSSMVVILAGNNKSSIRALVAARHLRNKNYDVVVCLVGIERERDLLEDLRRQIQLYRSFGGKVLNKNDFFEHLRKAATSNAGSSISLIVDALLGLTMSFEELRIGDQATVYELMEWANRNEAFVLSIDVPSGIDPTTGKVAIIDGSQLFVKPKYVVAVGTPKRGLLEAVTPPKDGDPLASGSVAQDDEWRLFIVDMGLGHAVWRKAGTKIRRGVDFDGKWVLEMKYRGEKEDSEDE